MGRPTGGRLSSRSNGSKSPDTLTAALPPVGLDALDVSRVEAGFLLAGVDYNPARGVLVPHRKSTPFELGLGWMVALDREPFVGQDALGAQRERGTEWAVAAIRR